MGKKADPKSELIDAQFLGSAAADIQIDRFNDYFAGLQKKDEDRPMPKTSNLDGLDLELSQSTKQFDQVLAMKKKLDKGVREPSPLIENNKMLESLDLNVGMDAILKLQNKWGSGSNSKPQPLVKVQ